jgi:hypothetical protein
VLKAHKVRSNAGKIPRMLPTPSNHNTSPEYFKSLCDRIGQSQEWIAQNSGISRRRIQYLAAGYRMINGERKDVEITYPEQFSLETLAEAGDRFNTK